MKFVTFGDIAGYSGASILLLISQLGSLLVIGLSIVIGIVTLCIQIRRWRRGD